MNEVETNVVEELFNINLSPANLSRFWVKVQKGDGCWEWSATKNNRGYGMVGINYHHYLAHRISYLIHNGPFQKRAKVLHKCDNPKCVNPEHLFLGSMKDNTKDMLEKGRGAVGTRSIHAKVTEDDVLQMRIMSSEGASTAEIARRFGLTPGTVSVAVRGLKWKHVGGPLAPTLARDHAKLFSQDQKDRIVERIKRGEYMSDIAREFGVSTSCIMDVKRNSGQFVIRKLRRRECPQLED